MIEGTIWGNQALAFHVWQEGTDVTALLATARWPSVLKYQVEVE
jgi:hypothetical protein